MYLEMKHCSPIKIPTKLFQEGKQILDDIAALSETINYGDLLWLDDAYIIENRILTEGPQAPGTPEPTAEMEIALDIAL